MPSFSHILISRCPMCPRQRKLGLTPSLTNLPRRQIQWILHLVTWDLNNAIQKAQHDEPSPAHCPTSKIFVHSALPLNVIQWVHTSPAFGHPGAALTACHLARQFWWPSRGEAVEEFILSRPLCAQHKPDTRKPLSNTSDP